MSHESDTLAFGCIKNYYQAPKFGVGSFSPLRDMNIQSLTFLVHLTLFNTSNFFKFFGFLKVSSSIKKLLRSPCGVCCVLETYKDTRKSFGRKKNYGIFFRNV
jgi:hypothetical protein